MTTMSLVLVQRLEPIIKQETRRVPILNTIFDYQVIGPAIREDIQKGRQKINSR